MKVLPHKMVQRHTARRQVSPVLMRGKLDAAVASERLQHLGFDQRRLTINVVLLRVGPEFCRVAVAF